MAEAAAHQAGHRQRLRQRFLESAGAGVADYELLELLLYAAHPRGDVKPLAKQLLKEFGSLGKVIHADPLALKQVEGVGEAVIASIKVAEAAATRILREKAASGPVISSWTALLDYCRVHMGHKKTEEFHILFLNSKNAMIADEVMQKGTVNQAAVYPREVVRRALELQASSIILAHNHPSGDTTPSRADIDVTQQIVAAAKPLGISIHDHLIIGGQNHYSFKSHGLL